MHPMAQAASGDVGDGSAPGDNGGPVRGAWFVKARGARPDQDSLGRGQSSQSARAAARSRALRGR